MRIEARRYKPAGFFVLGIALTGCFATNFHVKWRPFNTAPLCRRFLMTDAAIIADHLLSSNSGKIAVTNLVDGLTLGHFDADFLSSALKWWGEYVVQMNKVDEEIGASLGMMNSLFERKFPPDFVPPSTAMQDPHIRCRRAGGLGADEAGASIRDAAGLKFWADSEAIDSMEDAGIDITARGGQVSYQRLAKKDPASLIRRIRIDVGKSLTDLRKGPRNIFFYTDWKSLVGILDSLEFPKKADGARDALGLVHVSFGYQLVAVVFPAALVEMRTDRGRPTAIDAQGNPRFICDAANGEWEPGWGRTADLSNLGGATVGLPERVCGPMPLNATSEIFVEVHLIGVAQLPRGDTQGIGDSSFADFLEKRAIKRGGRALKDIMLMHLT
jgi:hypothetical protein